MADRKSYGWVYKDVSKKDLNKNQWNFSYDRIVSGKKDMECRSMSVLKKSFENTPYNLLNAKEIKSRYSLLYDKFNEKYREISARITHLMICYDRIYFLLDGEPDVKSIAYGTNICNREDVSYIVNGILHKTGVLERMIKVLDNNSPILRPLIDLYIKTRKHMCVVDNNKYIVDIFKSDIPFTKLTYLFFMPYPSLSIDISRVVSDNFMHRSQQSNIKQIILQMSQSGNISCEFTATIRNCEQLIQEELLKMPTLKREVRGLSEFIENVLKKNDAFKSISYVYYLPNERDKIDTDYVKNLFLHHMDEKYKSACKYVSLREQQKMRDEENKILRKAKEIEDKRNKDNARILYLFNTAMSLMYRINDIVNLGNCFYEYGKETGTVEFPVWMNLYSISNISRLLDKVYSSYQKLSLEKDEIYPICKILQHLNSEILRSDNYEYNQREIEYFDNIVPFYVKDDRKFSKKVYGDSSSELTAEQATNNINALKSIIKILIHLSEVFIGVQYASFGNFIGRYGHSDFEIGLAKIFTPLLSDKYKGDKSFSITENILEYSNRAYFLINYPTAFEEVYFSDNLTNEDRIKQRKEIMGIKDSFIRAYLDKLSGNGRVELLIRNDSLPIKEQCEVLNKVFDCVDDILGQYLSLYNKDKIEQYFTK